MAYCCSQCSFTAQFESALIMHYQLHHESSDGFPELLSPTEKSIFKQTQEKGLKLPVRTSSATRLLGKLKARICKSRTLFSHPEETSPAPESLVNVDNMSVPLSECSSKALKESVVSRTSALTTCMEETTEPKETYGCHLCHFDADRITNLDRHLLNHHKIGLEKLLKLVMAKTKDGLSEVHNSTIYGVRQPYYRAQDEILEEGEFIIETIAPKIKILKNASTNTDIVSSKEFNLEKNCQMISKEIENLLNGDKKLDDDDFLSKMQTLNDCMSKFVNSSNTLKKVLTKEYRESTVNVKEHFNGGEPFFNLTLSERNTPRDWERAHSEKMERNRNKFGESRSDKLKPSAESFYF